MGVAQTRPCPTLRAIGNRLLSRWRNSPYWPRLKVTRRIGGVAFEVELEPDSIGFQMYFGRYEPLTVRALRDLLRPGDTVFDVGANIGYLTAVAADAVGPAGQVHSFEPVPRCFRRLQRLAEINPTYAITVNQVAVGDRKGQATIHTSITNIGGHSMVPRLGDPDDLEAVFDVPVITLDGYIRRADVSGIALIKVDVEGFEFPVLRGLQNFLEQGGRPHLIVEVFPQAYPLLGETLADFAGFMRRYSYGAFALDAMGGPEIDVAALGAFTNVAFLSRRAQTGN